MSDFLAGLGDHLTDMTPVEILTLVPLATLIVVFGIQPGLLLDLVAGHGHATARVGRGRRGHRGRTEVVIAGVALRRRCILARIGVLALRPDGRRPEPGPATAPRKAGPRIEPGDLVPIAPLIAAVLTAAAILIVDLIWPGRSRPAVATALIGLGITARGHRGRRRRRPARRSAAPTRSMR